MGRKLREEIDALCHRNIATRQLEAHDALEQVTRDLVEMANALLERDGPDCKANIEDAANLVLSLVRARLRRDLENFIEFQRIEKDLRINALTNFIRSRTA
jgi:5'-deoxynucleotidase YfbR-like HD superfamily hydrolase